MKTLLKNVRILTLLIACYIAGACVSEFFFAASDEPIRQRATSTPPQTDTESGHESAEGPAQAITASDS